MMPRKPRSLARYGLSLIEVSVCSLLVGVVLIAALNTAGSSVRTTLAASSHLDGRTYAAELMAEIMAMPYHDASASDADQVFGVEGDEPVSPTSRAAFDDMDDYNGWSETGVLSERDGAARANTTDWSRGVVIQKVEASDVTSIRNDDATDTGLRLVTVTVVSPAGRETKIQALRCQSGAMQQDPAEDTTFVTGVLVNIKTSVGQATDAAAVLNHASDQ